MNVRQDAADGSLRPVGRPSSVGTAPGALLCAVACEGRDVVISTSEGAVYITDPLKSAPALVAELDCDIAAAVNVDGGVMLMPALEGESPRRLEVDYHSGEAVMVSELPRDGAPRLVRVDDGVLTRPLPARKLKGAYSRTDKLLIPDDLHALSDDYATAYCDISGLAAARHRYIQPVMARVTARDSRGVMLYRSAPVLITPRQGAQLIEAARPLAGDTLSELEATVLQATPFSIGLVFPAEIPAVWRERVALVEVETSEQIHPVTLTLPSVSRIESASSGVSTLWLSAPGVDTAAGGIATEGSEMRRRITGLLMNSDTALAVAHSMPMPSTAATFTGIYRASSPDCHRQVEAVMSAASHVPSGSSTTPAPWQLNYPHTFSAACAGVSGGKILWGNLHSRLFAGYTVAEQGISVSTGTSSLPATCVVTLDDGRMLVSSVTEKLTVTSQISPLIVYPHPSAVKINIILGMKMWEATLRPTPCRRMAYALSADLRPVTPATVLSMHIVPDASVVTDHYPEATAMADISSPLEIEATAIAATGTVTAITPELRAGSSLDIMRRHFYVFSRGGIASVTAGGTPWRLTPVMLDHRPVMMAQSVAEAADGIIAVAGGDLVKVAGNRVTTLMVNTGPCSVGGCGHYGEVWLVSATDDPTLIFNIATKYAYYRKDIYPEDMLTTGDRLLLRTSDGQLLDASSEVSMPAEVELTFRICLPRARAVRAFGVRMFSQTFDGKIILAADNGIHSPDGAYRVVDFDIDGELNRPLEARVLTHPFRYITLGIRAKVSHNSRLESAWCATLK